MNKDAVLTVRITNKLHAALKQREKETLVPTSKLVRQLIELKLAAEKRSR